MKRIFWLICTTVAFISPVANAAHKPLPKFDVPTISGKKLSDQDLHQCALLNVWAVDCSACRAEHSLLLKLKNQYHLPIYGLNYKDDRSVVANYLSKHGNPYKVTGLDREGDVAVELGVYGTPETFLINKKGEVIYSHFGTLSHAAIRKLIPLVKNCIG